MDPDEAEVVHEVVADVFEANTASQAALDWCPAQRCSQSKPPEVFASTAFSASKGASGSQPSHFTSITSILHNSHTIYLHIFTLNLSEAAGLADLTLPRATNCLQLLVRQKTRTKGRSLPAQICLQLFVDETHGFGRRIWRWL